VSFHLSLRPLFRLLIFSFSESLFFFFLSPTMDFFFPLFPLPERQMNILILLFGPFFFVILTSSCLLRAVDHSLPFFIVDRALSGPLLDLYSFPGYRLSPFLRLCKLFFQNFVGGPPSSAPNRLLTRSSCDLINFQCMPQPLLSSRPFSPDFLSSMLLIFFLHLPPSAIVILSLVR